MAQRAVGGGAGLEPGERPALKATVLAPEQQARTAALEPRGLPAVVSCCCPSGLRLGDGGDQRFMGPCRCVEVGAGTQQNQIGLRFGVLSEDYGILDADQHGIAD